MFELRSAIVLISLACWGVWLTQPSQSATLMVAPLEGPVNAQFQIVVRGVEPRSAVRIEVDRIDRSGNLWKSSAVFMASALGDVDVSSSVSLSGTYEGVSPYGLFCSVLPVSVDELPAYIANFSNRPDQPSTITTTLTSSPITVRAFVDNREIDSKTITRGFAVGTVGQNVAEAEWRGMYFPPATGVAVGEPVVVLSGSGGGLFTTTSALLASNGHPTLALGIYNYEDLPKALLNFPLEQVRDAARWLAQKSAVSKVTVLGISRGSEAAQLAAAYFPDTFSGVIAQVPSHLVGGALGPGTAPSESAWSLGGVSITPFVGPKFDDVKIAKAAKTVPGYRGTLELLSTWSDAVVEATGGIPYERLEAPLLILAAGADDVWPSFVSAEHIRNRMATIGKADQVETHIYPDAGHGMVYVGRGNALSSFGYSPFVNGFMSSGGTPNGNCEASFAAFADTLRFLGRVPRTR